MHKQMCKHSSDPSLCFFFLYIPNGSPISEPQPGAGELAVMSTEYVQGWIRMEVLGGESVAIFRFSSVSFKIYFQAVNC